MKTVSIKSLLMVLLPSLLVSMTNCGVEESDVVSQTNVQASSVPAGSLRGILKDSSGVGGKNCLTIFHSCITRCHGFGGDPECVRRCQDAYEDCKLD